MRLRRLGQGRRKRSDAGYTLTEMLVVIGIISLIAAVLTPAVLGQMSRARAKAAQLQLETLATEVENFHSDVGRYPTQQEGLQALVQDPGAQGWVGPYAKTRSLKDTWGNPVLYVLGSNGRTFQVESLGADGKPGGTGADHDLTAPTE
ncbi:type II secretion system major pseudopilin GspG [Caulobacter sp. KR2-114]|uniref:type II secretion system major pseudopilin GspG n=1 Tax=Caulobacter sp. KR2-114 TaxID=3400912 RepID=UPI003BFEBC9E